MRYIYAASLGVGFGFVSAAILAFSLTGTRQVLIRQVPANEPSTIFRVPTSNNCYDKINVMLDVLPKENNIGEVRKLEFSYVPRSLGDYSSFLEFRHQGIYDADILNSVVDVIDNNCGEVEFWVDGKGFTGSMMIEIGEMLIAKNGARVVFRSSDGGIFISISRQEDFPEFINLISDFKDRQ